MKIFSRPEIIEQLKNMNAPQDSVVIMHSSLSAIGAIERGAENLLNILIEYFTEKGGLFCVPTHTWNNLNKEITLDMTSDNNCLGAFSTIALRSGLGIRSENPTHSLVVFGDKNKAKVPRIYWGPKSFQKPPKRMGGTSPWTRSMWENARPSLDVVTHRGQRWVDSMVGS